MSIDKRNLETIFSLLNSNNIFLDSTIMNDTDFLLKLKYELMRHDVRQDIDFYFKNLFGERLKKICNKEYLIIPKIILILSNKCTLACKKCSMLIPYFQTSWEISCKEAIRNVDVFLSGVDEILNLNVIGGEPFLYKNLSIIVKHLISSKKVKHIAVFTNGTLLPNEETIQVLQNEKVEVVLSDYGNIVQMARFVNCIEQNNISLIIRSDNYWLDFGDTSNRGKNEYVLKKHFSNCMFSGNCKALLGNRLFICERAARLYALNIGYNSKRDFVILSENESNEEVRCAIRQIYSADVADACNYCDAGIANVNKIIAGEQINDNFTVSKYTIVPRENQTELNNPRKL